MKDTLAFLLLIIVGMIPIIMWFLQTAYFSIRDPKLLQSEEFQLRQQALNMIERKGEGIVSDPERIVEMTEIQFEIERSEIEHSSEKKDA